MANAKAFPGLPPVPVRTRAVRWLRRRLAGVVWVGVAALTVALYHHQESGTVLTGFAEEVRYEVASEIAGRLVRLEVVLNQEVSRGQIVASLGNDELLLQLQEARRELGRLACELDRERALWELDTAGHVVDQRTNLRRFARDASNTHVEYLVALAELAEDRILVQGLEVTLGRTRQLVAKDLTPVEDLDEDRIAFAALSEKIAGEEVAVAAQLEAHQDAEARYREFLDRFLTDAPDAAVVLQPLKSATEIQEIRIEMVNLAIRKCVLRSPAAGRVEEIIHLAGEVVDVGEPVLSIVEPGAAAVVAYLPERLILDLAPGDEVKVRRVADPGQRFSSTITSVGTSVRQLPMRLDPAGIVQTWGVAVSISLPASLAARPGEKFEVWY